MGRGPGSPGARKARRTEWAVASPPGPAREPSARDWVLIRQALRRAIFMPLPLTILPPAVLVEVERLTEQFRELQERMFPGDPN